MSKGPLRTPDYLAHIQLAIERIQRYTRDMRADAFLQNEMAQDAVIRNIEIIGEAANNIRKSDPDFAGRHAHVPWAVIYAMRNRVSHAYHHEDLEIIWNPIQNDLERLRKQMLDLLAAGDHGPPSTP